MKTTQWETIKKVGCGCEQPDFISEMNEQLDKKLTWEDFSFQKTAEIKKLKGQLLDSDNEVKRKLEQYSKTQRGLILSVSGSN